MHRLIERKLKQLKDCREAEVEFLKERVPELRARIANSKLLIKSLSSDFYKKKFSSQVKLTLPKLITEEKERLGKFVAELDALEERVSEDVSTNEFLLEAQDYFRVPDNCSHSLLEEFRKKYLPGELPVSKVVKVKEKRSRHAREKCENCGGDWGDIECESCLLCANVRGDKLTSNVENERFSGNSSMQTIADYERLVYFKEFLRQKQGKTRVAIPDVVLSKVISELSLSGVSLASAKEKDVRKILVRSGFSTFCELTLSILAKINPSYELLLIPDCVEKMLCKRFLELDKAFRKGQETKGKMCFGRKSMLSYNYLCREICAENNFSKFLNCWKISKSFKVQQKHKETFLKIKEFI